MRSLLTVTSFAPSYDLTVLETVKLELGIEDDSQDERLAVLIHQVSEAIATICNRVFAEETVSEVFRLSGFRSWDGSAGGLVQDGLVLRRRPISSITSVIEDTVVVDDAEYECNFETGILYRLSTDDFRIGWSANKITVTYVAGWFLLDDLPYDIERACILWVKSFYIHATRSSGDSLVKVEEVPGLMRKEYFSISQVLGDTSTSKYDPPPEVMVLLNPYIETAIR